MSVKDTITERRAYRSLEPFNVNEDLIYDLTECAGLSSSCFNNQPWRYVFVYEREALKNLQTALSENNQWAHDASMIIAVFSRKDLDCVVANREYFLFDTGMATAFLILRATELGLVAHPMAGFSESKAKESLEIPDEMTLISLIAVGKKSREINSDLSEKQKASEEKRPERLPFDQYVYLNSYKS